MRRKTIEAAEGTLCPTDAGKILSQPQKKFFLFLSANSWIYKRGGKGAWLGYSDKEKAGYVEHTETVVTRYDGTSKTTVQVRITQKGLVKLAKILGVTPLSGEAA